jgi:hypothetical protein
MTPLARVPIAGRIPTCAALFALLASCASMPGKPVDGFHVEPQSRFTILPGAAFPDGAIVHVRVEHLTGDQAFLMNRCTSDPCNSAMIAASIPGSPQASDELTYKITDPGDYYLWVGKKLPADKWDPVKVKAFTGTRSSFEATFENGAKAIGELTLPAPCTADQCTPGTFSLPGNGDTNGGSITYKLAFPVPDGEKSMQPDVSLNYSSRAGNGPLGVGWSLSASSSIFRCPTIWETEGYAAPVHYDSSDHLCLDGDFLVRIQAESGKDTAYGLETDTGLAVGLRGSIDNKKSIFFAMDGKRNGRFYGKPYVPIGARAPLSWLLTARMNADRLFITYFYTDVAGETVLSEIRYTGKAPEDGSAPTRGDKFVRFDYARRREIDTSFLAGGETRGSVLLTGIRSGVLAADDSEDVQFEYELSYHPSPSTSRLLLDAVTGCQLVQGKKTCAYPTAIEWHEAALRFSDPRPLGAEAPGVAIAPAWHPGERVPDLASFATAGDFDADGRRELMARGADGSATVYFVGMDAQVTHRSPLANVLELAGPLPVNACFEIRSVGTCDLVGGKAGRLAALTWRDAGFADPEPTAIAYTGDLLALDADGDGQRDLVQGGIRDGHYEVSLYRNAGSTDRRLAFESGKVIARFASAPQLHLQGGPYFFSGDNTILVRSADRIEHILHLQSTPGGIVRTDVIDPRKFGISDAAQKAGIFLADINGDGLTDVVYVDPKTGTWQVQINKDGVLAPPQETNHPDDRQTALSRAATLVFDVNADGKDELVFPAQRRVDFCIVEEPQRPLCGDELGRRQPQMDLGIYEFEAIRFVADADGRYMPQRLGGLHLIGQANRARAGDLFGDGYVGLISAFDRGVKNGRFRSADGTMNECPEGFGCGVSVSVPAHSTRADRQNAFLDTVARVTRGPNDSFTWNLYPLSSAARGLYRVPPLGSQDRFIEPGRYYFTSSMPVVGEETDIVAGHASSYSYDYGGAVDDAQGRGMQGFKWIIVHDKTQDAKFGTWWRQATPFTGVAEFNWTEAESDNENDYLHGSPGHDYVSFKKTELHCYGPPASPISKKAGCLPSDDPLFHVFSGPIPDAKN